MKSQRSYTCWGDSLIYTPRKKHRFGLLVNPAPGAITAAMLAFFCTASASRAAVNLLIDPGFENNPLGSFDTILSTTLNAYPGIWGAEQATITTATGGILPDEGTQMLSETGSLSTWQTVQITDLSTGPEASLIATSLATLSLSAQFNVEASAVAAKASVIVTFYSGTNRSTDAISSIQNSLSLDDSGKTWQTVTTSGIIPANTQWVLSQVTYEDSTMAGRAGYVDNAVLTVVPEPGISSLLGIGASALLLRRRRQGRPAFIPSP